MVDTLADIRQRLLAQHRRERHRVRKPAAITGARLRALRLQHRWTQFEMAQRLGVTPGAIAAWETEFRGRRPSPAALRRIQAFAQTEVEAPQIPTDAAAALAGISVRSDLDALAKHLTVFVSVAPQFAPGDVKRIRARLHLSQAQLGNLLGAAQSTVARWELGLNSPGSLYRRQLAVLEQAAMRLPELA